LVDTQDLKSCDRKVVRVQVPPGVLLENQGIKPRFTAWLFILTKPLLPYFYLSNHIFCFNDYMHMKYIIFICLLSCQQTFSQNSYKLSYALDVPIYGTSIVMGLTSTIIRVNRTSLSSAELANLSPLQVNKLDRGAIFNNSVAAAKASDGIIYASLGAPLLFLSFKETRKDFLKIATMTYGAAAFATGLSLLSKEIFLRKRPFVYRADFVQDPSVNNTDLNVSFFSGHTATAAAVSFSVATIYHHYFPKSKWRYIVWSLAATLPAITGGLRVKSGKHFWTDVIAGYTLGAGIGVLVPVLHQKINLRKKEAKSELIDSF
jgi:membrane-associated phospholipid phosphatase